MFGCQLESNRFAQLQVRLNLCAMNLCHLQTVTFSELHRYEDLCSKIMSGVDRDADYSENVEEATAARTDLLQAIEFAKVVIAGAKRREKAAAAKAAATR